MSSQKPATPSTWRWRFRTLLGIGLCCAFAFLLSTCFGNIVTKWTEQVQLSDGRVIEVQRRTSHEPVGPWGAGESLPVSVSLRIRDQSPAVPQWQDARVPILLEVDPRNGEFVLICTTNDGRVWERHGRPTPPYWQFRLNDERWVEQPVDDLFFGRSANLIPDPAWLRGHRGLVTLQLKKRWFDETPLVSWYLSVDQSARLGLNVIPARK